MRYALMSNERWVGDATQGAVSLEHGTVYRCIEDRCEVLPPHAHSGRAYLVYSRERLNVATRPDNPVPR